MAVTPSINSTRIARNTLMLYFRMLVLMGVNLYTSRVVLACLGVVDYGVYNAVGGMVTMFAFLNTALSQASQRYIAYGIQLDSVGKQRQMFSMLINVHALLAVLVVLLCESVGLWLFFNKLVIPTDRMHAAYWVMQCAIAAMAVKVMQVPFTASIYGHEKMDVYAYISIVEGGLNLLAVLSLKYILADKLLVYGVQMMGITVAVALVCGIYCRWRLANCCYVLYWRQGLFKELISYTGWSLIGNLAWTLNSQGINFLINIFFGPVYNATRGIAAHVESAVTSFLTNFIGAAIPGIIKSYAAGDVEGTVRLNFKSTKVGFLLFMCLSLPLISVIDTVLNIWLVMPPPQCSLFCVLSLVYIQCNSLGGTIQNIVQATGRIRNYQLCYGGLKLLVLPVVYVLYRQQAPVISYLWALIVASLLGLCVQLLIVRNLVPQFTIRGYLCHVMRPVLAAYAIPAVIALLAWCHPKGLFLAIGVCMMEIALCVTCAWLIGLTHNERTWIRGIVRSKLQLKH